MAPRGLCFCQVIRVQSALGGSAVLPAVKAASSRAIPWSQYDSDTRHMAQHKGQRGRVDKVLVGLVRARSRPGEQPAVLPALLGPTAG